MKYIVTVMYLMCAYGLFFGYYGAGLLALLTATFLLWAGIDTSGESSKSVEDIPAITDDDIDPRIKS